MNQPAPPPPTPIPLLQQQLQAAADPGTRQWWERYLKGAIPFRGVKMAIIRHLLHKWVATQELAARAYEDQEAIALALLRQPYAEDKLAGILYLQEILLPAGALPWSTTLPRFARLFDEGYIADWNTCDWFCVKVLGPLVVRDGVECARAIAAWSDARTLWQRRAAAVAFVNLAPRGNEALPGLPDLLLAVCAVLIADPARFSQTGAGWALRELSRAEPEAVATFITTHRDHFLRAALRMATARLPAEQRATLLAR
jgi:3-methyladenine DNA glycosylase AlkD